MPHKSKFSHPKDGAPLRTAYLSRKKAKKKVPRRVPLNVKPNAKYGGQFKDSTVELDDYGKPIANSERFDYKASKRRLEAERKMEADTDARRKKLKRK